MSTSSTAEDVVIIPTITTLPPNSSTDAENHVDINPDIGTNDEIVPPRPRPVLIPGADSICQSLQQAYQILEEEYSDNEGDFEKENMKSQSPDDISEEIWRIIPLLDHASESLSIIKQQLVKCREDIFKYKEKIFNKKNSTEILSCPFNAVKDTVSLALDKLSHTKPISMSTELDLLFIVLDSLVPALWIIIPIVCACLFAFINNWFFNGSAILFSTAVTWALFSSIIIFFYTMVFILYTDNYEYQKKLFSGTLSSFMSSIGVSGSKLLLALMVLCFIVMYGSISDMLNLLKSCSSDSNGNYLITRLLLLVKLLSQTCLLVIGVFPSAIRGPHDTIIFAPLDSRWCKSGRIFSCSMHTAAALFYGLLTVTMDLLLIFYALPLELNTSTGLKLSQSICFFFYVGCGLGFFIFSIPSHLNCRRMKDLDLILNKKRREARIWTLFGIGLAVLVSEMSLFFFILATQYLISLTVTSQFANGFYCMMSNGTNVV